jgi:hypothetical protein
MKKWKLDLNINLDLNTRLELNTNLDQHTHMDPNTHLNLNNHMKEAWEGHEDHLLPSVTTKKENVLAADRRTLFSFVQSSKPLRIPNNPQSTDETNSAYIVSKDHI